MNFFGDLAVLLLLGEDYEFLEGDCYDRLGESCPLIGELSLTSLPTSVFCIATFSENFFNGSFLSSFSSSAGVY